jgi:hypothetical protein
MDRCERLLIAQRATKGLSPAMSEVRPIADMIGVGSKVSI